MAGPSSTLVAASPDAATPVGALPGGAATGTALPTAALAGLPDGGTSALRDDAIAGTPVVDSSRQQQEDAETLQTLRADLEAHLPGGDRSDPIAGTPVSSRDLAVMNRVFQACGEAVVADPVAGMRARPTLLVRKALQLGSQDPIPYDAATRLLRRATGLDNPYEVAEAVSRRQQLPADQRQAVYAASPDVSDPLVQATLAQLTDGAPDGGQQLLPETAAGGPDPVRFGAEFRSAMLKVRRWLSRAGSQYDRPSDVDGQLAHMIIGMHYLVAHPGHRVIIDRFAWSPFTTALQTLAEAAAGDSTFKTVQGWLVSAVTGLVGQPDILDLDTQEVYEIKPLHRIFEGAAQLVGRYLLPLNIGVLGTEAAARGLIEKLVPQAGAGLVWTGNKPFLPGYQWQPSQIYPLPDGRFMFAVRAVPGVIGYQILGTDKADADGPTFEEMQDRIAEMISALVAVAATTIVGVPGTEQWPGSGALPSPVGRVPIDVDAVAAALIATGLAAPAVYAAVEAIAAADLLAVLGRALLFLLEAAAL
jgi:hypothetical protein